MARRLVHHGQKLCYLSRGPLHRDIPAAGKQTVPPQLRQRRIAAAVIGLIRRQRALMSGYHILDLGGHDRLQEGIQHIPARFLPRGQIAFLSYVCAKCKHRHRGRHLQKELLIRLFPERR